MKKTILIVLLLTSTLHLYALSDNFLELRSLGLKGGIDFNWNYKSVGSYSFIENIIVEPSINVPDGFMEQSRRGANQLPQIGGTFGVFAQVGLFSHVFLAPELAISFNNGTKYTGNAKQIYIDYPNHTSTDDPIENAPALTGEISQTWHGGELRLMGQYYPFNPDGKINVFFELGPSFSFVLGRIKEYYRPAGFVPGLNGPSSESPYETENTRFFTTEHIVNFGLSAGVGIEFGMGPGYILFNLRSTYNFFDNDATYISNGKNITVSKPLSINIGYAIKLD